MGTQVFGDPGGNLVQARRHLRLAVNALERAGCGLLDDEHAKAARTSVQTALQLIEELDALIFALSSDAS